MPASVVFAACGSEPVCAQALQILKQLGITALNEEHPDVAIPADAVYLVSTGPRANIPGRFTRDLRRMPVEERKVDIEKRGIKLSPSVLDIEQLVLLKPCSQGDGWYRGRDADCFRASLMELAHLHLRHEDVPHAKLKRTAKRSSSRKASGTSGARREDSSGFVRHAAP